MTESAHTFGDIATTRLFENARVRIWEMRIQPGEVGGLHRHETDHILVQISGDRMAVLPEPETAGPFTEYIEADVVPGYLERFLGSVHTIGELKVDQQPTT